MGLGKRKCIGIFFDWPEAGRYHCDLFRGIQSAAKEFDFNVLVFANRGARPEIGIRENSGRLMIDCLGSEALDGLIVTSGQEFFTREFAKGCHVPIVSITQAIEGRPAVLTDTSPGFDALLEHVFSFHGYSKPVMVTGYKTVRDSMERVALFNAALARHGMPVREDAVYYGEFNIEDGAPAVRHFYDKLGMKPDLIVCANDGMALGVRQALTRRGLRVPGDVAVTGFDDTRLSPWLESPLTTVRQPVEASGRKAVEMLKEYMDGKSLNAAVSYQKTELIVRGSCGCRPGDSEASSRKSAERGEGSILDNDAIESFITRDKERVVESALSRFCNEIANNLSVGGHAEREAEILETLGIDSFCLASFDDGNPSMDGASRLIIAWVGGRRIELPAGGLRFPTRAILPEAAFPRRRFTLIGEALACGEECFGILWLPAGAIGNNIYEVFRVRLSDAIRTAKTMRMLQVLNARLEEARIKLEELSITDELTGHYNRRGFMTIADQQIAYCRRRGEGFWILYIDLDGLKAINDRYSHEEGDVAIRRFGDAISSAFRESDIVARFGGDEFTIMAPNTPKGALERLVGRLAKSVSAANLELARDWELSISLGAFYSDPKCAFALDVMMDIADKDLHAAKRRKKAQG